MASEYKQSSPSSNMLNMGSMGATPGFGMGSQSGSEFEFGTPQSLNIDTMMAGNDLARSTTMPDYRSAPGGLPGYANVFDPNMGAHAVAPTSAMQPQHRGSMSSLPDGHSPILQNQHRLSFSSNGAFVHQDRTNSIGSDNTNPMGDNALANHSNETVDSHHPDDGSGKPNDTTGSLPAWSELKTKAGKERKRLPLACIACRRKKIRCSGEKPACKHCMRSRIPCVYKVTTRKAAPRTDYMAMLDKRLKRMEERVIKVIPKEEQNLVTQTGRAVVKPALPPPPPKSAGSSKKRGAESAFGDELDEWANMDPSASVLKADADQDMEKEPLKVKDSEEQNLLLQDGADKLPPKEIQEHLAEVFFDFVYGQSYPLLHKPSFMRRLQQGTIAPVLTLAVCAMAARFSNHPGVRTEPAFLRGESWASAAREIALARYDQPNITILIVYLILGLHEFGTCQGGRSWMFGGMAQRMAYALQLHKDLDHEPKLKGSDEKTELTFTDREIRRRTMWSCFLMDRFNSSGTERPIFVGEHYIRAQLPIRDKYYQMEVTGPTEDLEGNVPNPVEPNTGQMSDAKDNMGVSAYLIRLVAIWGRLINYLNLGGKDRDTKPMWVEGSAFHDIKRDINDWKDTLPKTLCYTEENLSAYASEGIANQFIFLHIVYNQIVLFMNHFALPTANSRPQIPKDMPQSFVKECSHLAYDAANQIPALVNEGMDHRVVAPFAGYSAFLSSTVQIQGVFSKRPAQVVASKQNLAYNVKYLTKMKKYWGMFHFVTENLRELYRRHADAARSGGASGGEGKEGDQAVFQYGDWFDRYPHGVSGTDYEEPSAEVKKEPGADAVLGQKSDLQSVEEFFSKLSPPSRAVNNQTQQPQPKKASKKRSKHENKASTISNTTQQTQDTNTIEQQQQQHPITDDILGTTHDFQDTLAYSQHSAAFPPGYQGPPNALLMPPNQHIMSQLDRQMVLNSYAGVNAAHADPHSDPVNNTNHNPNATLLDPSHQQQPLDQNQFNFNAFSQNNAWNGEDQSMAWFMPFNMDPPPIGEDNNLFAGGLDWTNLEGLGGFGPTGLTPRPDVEVDTGQDGMSGDGGMDGMDYKS